MIKAGRIFFGYSRKSHRVERTLERNSVGKLDLLRSSAQKSARNENDINDVPLWEKENANCKKNVQKENELSLHCIVCPATPTPSWDSQHSLTLRLPSEASKRRVDGIRINFSRFVEVGGFFSGNFFAATHNSMPFVLISRLKNCFQFFSARRFLLFL